MKSSAYIIWMSKVLIIFTLLFALPITAAEEYSLGDILKIANERSDDIAIISKTYEAGIHEVNSFKASVFPYISFSTGAKYINNSKEAFGVIAAQIPVDRFKGVDYNWRTSLRQPLITFGRLGIVYKMAKQQEKLLRTQKQFQRDLFFVNVIHTYNQALLTLNFLKVAEKSLEHAKKLYQFVELGFERGAQSKIVLLRSTSLKALAVAGVKNAELDYWVALNQLKNLLGMTPEESLALQSDEDAFSDYLEEIKTAEPAPLSVKLQELSKTLAYQRAKYERANFFPSISLVGGLSNQFIDFDMPGSSSPSAADLVNTDFFNYHVGLQMDWTVFDGFGTPARYKKAQTEAEIRSRELSKLERESAIDVYEAQQRIVIVQERYDASRVARDAAHMAFEQAEQDYKNGHISVTDFLQIERELREAERRLYEAHAGGLMANVNLRVVKGLSIYREIQ